MGWGTTPGIPRCLTKGKAAHVNDIPDDRVATWGKVKEKTTTCWGIVTDAADCSRYTSTSTCERDGRALSMPIAALPMGDMWGTLITLHKFEVIRF